MYRGTGQGNWNHGQGGNIYPGANQYKQRAPDGSNNYGYMMGQGPDNPGFPGASMGPRMQPGDPRHAGTLPQSYAAPNRPQNPGDLGRNAWNQVNPTGMQHPGYYRSPNPGSMYGHYSNMDPKMAQENPNPAAMNQMRRNDYTAWRHPSPQQPPVSGTGKPDASYYPTSHGQFQQQFGQHPHQSEYMRSPMQKPGQDFHYTRGSVPSQQQYMTYQQAPPQFQQGVRRSVFSGYPQAEQSLSQSAPVRQTPRFRSASNDMSFGVQDRYPTPAGVNNPRMVTPVPKPGTRRPSNDVYNPQISPSGMPGQNASLQGDRHPSYGPYHQMPKSAPNMQQQIMSMHTQAGPKPTTENFNLDSLLEDCVGSTGSFMQQLEDVVPNSGDGSSKSSGVQVNQRSPASQKNFMMRSPLSQPNIRMPAQLNQPTTPIRRPGPYHQSLRGPMMPDQSLQRTPQMNPARPSGDARSQVGNYQWHGDSNMLRSPRHSMPLGSPEPMRKPSPLHSPQHPLVMEPHQQIMKSPVRSSEMSNQNQFVANSQQSQIPISVPNSQNSHQKQISQHVGSYGPFQPFPQPSMPGQGPTTTNDQIQASTLPESTLNLNAPPLNLPQDVALTNQTASQAKSPQASLNANTSYTDFNVSAGSNQDHSESDLSISDKAPSEMATMDQMQDQPKQVNDVTLDEKTQLPSSESTNVTEAATVENTSISSEKIEDSNNEDTTKDQTITNELTGDPSLPKQDVLPSVTHDDTANEIQPQPDSDVATSKPQPMLSPTSAQAPMTQGPSVDNNASKSVAQVLPAAPPVRPVPPSMPPSAIPHPMQYPSQSFPPGPTVPDTYPHGGENRHPTPGTTNVPQMMHPAPQPGLPMHDPRLQPGPVQVMHRPPGPRPPMPPHPGKGMYPQPNAMHMQGANRGVYPAAGHPGRPGYRPTEPHRFPPRPFGSANQGYYSGMNYHMQHPGGMMPQQPQHPRQHFAGAPPGHMPGYPYSGDGAMRPGWMGPMHPMNHADGVRPGVPPRASSDFGIGDKSGRKSKLPKEAESPQKAKKQKKTGEKKGVLSDSSEFASDSAKALTKGTPSKGDRKRKKPPATFKTKKKKRKQGDEEDDFDKLLPSDAVINTNLEKRRSARNVKRKQYVETFETQLSDEISDSELELVANDMAEKQANLRLAAEETEDQMIVEKILDIRARRVPKVKVNENDEKTSNDEETEDQSEETKTAEEGESDKPDGDIQNTTTGEESDVKKPDDTEEFEEVEEYFLKYKNFSYLHCEWKIRDEIQDKRVDGKIKRYKTKMASLPDYLKSDMSEAFNPDFVEVERVLDVAHEEGDSEYPAERHYFIKWCSLPYEDSTWEREKDICPTKIREFEERCKYRPPINPPELPHKSSFRELGDQDAMFLNNNCLRDYQLEGVNWLLFNWYNRRNCILADEMGLGKTVQSITFLQKVFDTGLQGPFLIVAPLSTICNWQREFMSWTGMNVVVYHGSQASRDMIKAYEFLCRDENLDEMPGQYKMHAVVTTYEMIVNESSHLLEIQWKCAIIDEAHRLKNQTCKLADSLRSMHCDYKVLLTGTPLQNNVEELFSLLSFLQPEIFSSSEAFITEFGDMKNNSQVEKLQELLKPMMLRRLKEDVEKSLAPKEETIIEVELTSIQKKYYRAIMEKNFEFLSKGAISGNTPNLMNTMMELRKCCNHPYLIKGAEDKIHAEQGESESSLQTMIHSSGKLVLIDKLLPRLKTGGHRVLVFSQMVRCLDILEDYLVQRQYSYERIDGGIRGSDRQAAIDRFSKPDSERFVFLLCTRAGGLGINLTAADTVIIFDSDWNPQNDLQAQARCHRIGQTKPVKIYRLITRNSYEREMFDKASLKLGLDKAVLQSISGRQDDPNQNAAPALSKQEVENLLKLGAYGAIMDENDDANKFCEEDIDQILQRRTQTIKIAPGEKGSTFSKASFISNKEGSDISLNDPNFWEKWAKKADLDIDRLKNNKLIIEEPRRRKQTRRFGGMTGDVEVLAEIGSDSDSDYDGKTKSRRQKNKMKMKNWSKKDFFRVEKTLLTFGWGRWKCMLEKGGLPTHIKAKELETVCRAILMYCLKFYSVDDRIKIFLWTLITPTNCSSISSLPNLDDATSSPRGRKDESDSFYERISQEWIKEIDVNAVLPDDSFKRHLQTHSTKIILRVRMVQFLKTEILGSINGDIDEITPEQLDINFPDMIHELQPGWDFECDRSLLFGVYKHGFGKYSLIRADPKLVFLKKFGMPDDKALADDLEDLTYDDNNDPEYKPAKLNFSEYSEFEDSPVPNTPETGPNSPVSSSEPSQDGGKNKDENSKDRDEDSQDQNKDEKAENPNTKESERSSKTPPWPSTSELNSRVRRIVAVYQKQHKQIRSRLMGLNQSLPKSRLRESSKERSHWTRREESDFYRTVSTFGIEYTKQGFSWARFRKLAKLDKKSDRSLEMYYLAFKAMCEKACGHKTQIPEEIVNLNVTRITEERASRTLYRIELLNRIRLDVLQHKNLDENLKKCERSIDLPAWWKPGEHDKELLIGMDRHGVTRTDVHILNDRSLSFLKCIEDQEKKMLEKNRKKIHASEGSSTKAEASSKDKSDNEQGKSSEPQPAFKEEDLILGSTLYDLQKWPKDRILIQRVEHICYCVVHGKWPISRMPEESIHIKTPINVHTLSHAVIGSLPKGTGSRSSNLLLGAEPQLLDEASSKLFSSILAAQKDFSELQHLFKNKNALQGDGTQSKKSQSKDSETADHARALGYADSPFDLGLASSKFNETLQTLLGSDLSRFTPPQKSVTKTLGLSPSSKDSSKLPPSSVKHEEKSTPALATASEKASWLSSAFESIAAKKEKNSNKKKTLKSKTGFISPAVLPPESRIPVYNPSEKIKLVGEDAPLNKDLADWLKKHRGFVVDYKALREKLNNEPTESSKGPTSSNASTSQQPKQSSKDSIKTSERSETPEKSAHEPEKNAEPVESQAAFERQIRQAIASQQANLLNQPLMNSAGILNALYGNMPDMSALTNRMLAGLPPFVMDAAAQDPMFHQSSSESRAKREQQSRDHEKNAESQLRHMASLLGFGNVQNPADLNALTALLGGAYPPPVNVSEKDIQKQLKQLFQQQAPSFDPKALQFPGFAGMPSVLPGMQGMMNPLLYGMYGMPELAAMPDYFQPMHMQSFLENEYANLKDGKNLNGIQDLLMAQQMASMGFDINSSDFQKFLRAQESLQTSTPVSLGKTTPSGQNMNDFDDNLQSVYQQLHASSLQQELKESRKKEKAKRYEKKSSGDDEAPVDLRSSK